MENVEKLLQKIIENQAYQIKLLEALYEEKDQKDNKSAERKKEMAEHMARIRGVLTSAAGNDRQAVKIFDQILTAGMPK